MVMTDQPCVPLVFEDRVVSLTVADQAEQLLAGILKTTELAYYTAVISMPFADLNDLRVRYRQNLFCEKKNEYAAGVMHAEKTGLAYAMSQLSETGKTELLVHPAIPALQEYDKKNGSDFSRSLYYYLYYERSIQKAAEQVHIHRNSFLYRIQRIRDLLPIDLDDPAERCYLLLSYEMMKA